MRNKNTVIFLLIVFVAICAYNLTWTVIQFNAEDKLNNLRSEVANIQAKAAEGVEVTAQDSAILREFDALQTDEDFQERYRTATQNSFTLGLDLQGGMFVTLEVGIEALVRQMAGAGEQRGGGAAGDPPLRPAQSLAVQLRSRHR